MKRSSCLSAMLVGLSVTALSSVALAAPEPEPSTSKKPTLVAQAKPASNPTTKTVQPSDPPPAEGGGGTPAPATTPTAPAEPAAPAAAPAESAQPAISVGTTTVPGADKPAEAEGEAKKKPPVRRWAGSQVFTYVSASTATFSPGQQQDYNPTVDYALWLQPRFTISESFQARGLLVFNYEFTNSDDTKTKNEPRFSDTLLSLWYRKIPEIPGIGVKPMVSVNLGLPSSPESRARTLLFNPGLGLQLSKSFEHVLGGEIDLISGVSYSHPIYRYTTPELRDENSRPAACLGDANTCAGQLTGTMNPSDSMLYSLIIVGEWGKFSPALMYRGSSQWAYHPKEVSYLGRPVTSPNGFTPTNVRQSSYFSFWLDYNWNTWLTTEVGYWMSRSILDEDGQVGNPFFNRYQDMRVYLGANFNIDNIMKTLEGGAADAGVVRAKNNRGPAVTF